MGLLLSRILTYLNGAMQNDYYYKICNFIIFNYLDIFEMSEEEFLDKGAFRKEELYSFLLSFGFSTYEDFRFKLEADHQLRLNQIRVRLFGETPQKFLAKMDKAMDEEVLANTITSICEHFYKAKRIIIFGGLYPCSIAVELQTDMISFGRPFIHYHKYDPIQFNEDDVVIFVSATGRSLKEMKKYDNCSFEKAYSLLITQNRKYTQSCFNGNTTVIYVPGKFDSIDFNYQIMSICDLIRLRYFQQYYL